MQQRGRFGWLAFGTCLVATISAFVSELRLGSSGGALGSLVLFAAVLLTVTSLAMWRLHSRAALSVPEALARLRRSVALGVVGGLGFAFLGWVAGVVFGANTTLAVLSVAFQVAVGAASISGLIALRSFASRARTAAVLVAIQLVAGTSGSILEALAPHARLEIGGLAEALIGVSLAVAVSVWYWLFAVVRQVAATTPAAAEGAARAKRGMEILSVTLVGGVVFFAVQASSSLLAILVGLIVLGLAASTLVVFDSLCVFVEDQLAPRPESAPHSATSA